MLAFSCGAGSPDRAGFISLSSGVAPRDKYDDAVHRQPVVGRDSWFTATSFLVVVVALTLERAFRANSVNSSFPCTSYTRAPSIRLTSTDTQE